MSKRFLILVTTALFALGVVACGDESPDDDNGTGGTAGKQGTGGTGGDGGTGGAGGSGGSGGTGGTGGTGGMGGSGGTGGTVEGGECTEAAHLPRLRDVPYNAMENSGFYMDVDGSGSLRYTELEDGLAMDMKVISTVGESMTFAWADEEVPDEGHVDVRYKMDFPSSIQSGIFQRGESVRLRRMGNWTIVIGDLNIAALYRFESTGGIPVEYDPSLGLDLGDDSLDISLAPFCEFPSSCTPNPSLLAIVARSGGQTRVLYNFEEGLGGSWFGNVGAWTVSNDAAAFQPGVYCTPENRGAFPACDGVPDFDWACDRPLFTQVITAIYKP